VTYTPTGQTTYDNDCTEEVENDPCPDGQIAIFGPVPCSIPADATPDLFDLIPSLVHTGETVTIIWETTGAVSCRITSDSGWQTEWPEEGGNTSGSVESPAIETGMCFSLECTNELDENPTVIATECATVVPTWVEK
jgi:hypothetical protein